jgi:SAM-dependent methyltransferase
MDPKESFDLAPKIYDDGRPAYPDEVIDWIIQRTGISMADQILEIGPGTGQATVKFADRGYRVHCVERGKNLAEFLVQKCGPYQVTVDVSTFEDWQPQPAFETPLIYIANTFHWLNPDIRFKKCSDLLRDGGYLALMWNLAPYEPPPVVKKAYDLLLEFSPGKSKNPKTKAVMEEEWKEAIASSGYFVLDDFLEYPWQLRQSRETIALGLFSQSSFLSLEKHTQKELSTKILNLFEGLEENIVSESFTTVYLARKTDNKTVNYP